MHSPLRRRLPWALALAAAPFVFLSACAGGPAAGSANSTPSRNSPIPITGVTDGVFSVSEDFFNDPAAYELLVAEHSSAELPFGTYLVGGDELVLVDAGLGPDFPATPGVEAGRLLDELAAAGVAPDNIQHVVISHLHADHTGWLATREGGVTFPNAQVYIGQGDWDDLAELAQQLPPWTTEALRRLKEEGQVTLLEGDREIVPGVTAVPAPGHTRGHTVVTVDDEGPKRLIVGDAVYFPGQLKHLEYSALHDDDHAVALATREWLAEELRAGSIILAPHFPGLAPFSD